MWDRVQLKAKGKEAFKANYWKCVLIGFILTALTGATSAYTSSQTRTKLTESEEAYLNGLDPKVLLAVIIAVIGVVMVAITVSLILRIFLWNPLEVGCYQFLKKNIDDPNTGLDEITTGFSDYGHIFGTLFLRDLFLTLWTMLFIIPGIIKGYSYRMVPYILKDEPNLSATEVITRSREMMNGNKWKAFVLDLSFLGWHILGAITCGLVEVFWTAPYVQSTNAALYLALRDNRQF